MAKKLLVIGDLAIEMGMALRRIPAPGYSCEEEGYFFLPGGPAGNAALTATYFGAEASLCSRVGKDGNGDRLRRFFADRGIGVNHVFSDSAAQTGMIVSIGEEGYNKPRTVIYRGASASLSAGDVGSALAEKPDMLYLSCEVNASLASSAISSADLAGVPVFLDASSLSLLQALAEEGARVQMLYTQDTVLEAFSGVSIQDVGTTLKCCLSLGQTLRAEYFAVRMRNRGLFLYDGRTYNIAIVSDADDAKPKSGFADIEAAVLATEFLVSGQAYNACGIAAVADILARTVTDYRFPTREAVASYIQKHEIPFTV